MTVEISTQSTRSAQVYIYVCNWHPLYCTMTHSEVPAVTTGSWQDDVVAVIQWIFVIALLPTLLHPTDKPTFATAVVTGTSLFVMAVTFTTVLWYVSALSMAAGGTAWTILAYQRYRINQQSGEPLFRLTKSFWCKN